MIAEEEALATERVKIIKGSEKRISLKKAGNLMLQRCTSNTRTGYLLMFLS